MSVVWHFVKSLMLSPITVDVEHVGGSKTEFFVPILVGESCSHVELFFANFSF